MSAPSVQPARNSGEDTLSSVNPRCPEHSDALHFTGGREEFPVKGSLSSGQQSWIKEIDSKLAELEGCNAIGMHPSLCVSLSYCLVSELWFLLHLSDHKRLEERYFMARVFLEQALHPIECC